MNDLEPTSGINFQKEAIKCLLSALAIMIFGLFIYSVKDNIAASLTPISMDVPTAIFKWIVGLAESIFSSIAGVLASGQWIIQPILLVATLWAGCLFVKLAKVDPLGKSVGIMFIINVAILPFSLLFLMIDIYMNQGYRAHVAGFESMSISNFEFVVYIAMFYIHMVAIIFAEDKCKKTKQNARNEEIAALDHQVTT